MKIAHIAKYFYPETGGIEATVKNIVDYCAEKKVESSIIVFTRDRELAGQNLGYQTERFYTPIKIASMPLSWSYYRAISRIEADIIHLHTPNPLACSALRQIKNPPPLVITHHADIVGRKFLKTLVSSEIKFAYRLARKIVVTSENYLHLTSELTPYRDKIVIIPLGVKRPEDVSPRQLQSDEEILILTIGHQVPYKGFKYLIEAVRAIPDASLFLIGSGRIEEKLRKQAADCDRIIFLGEKADVIKELWLRKATLFCLPSVTRAEAFGMVLIEAMSYGLPIISTEIGSGMSFVNIDGQTGFNVPPRNPEALTKAINKLLSDKELYHSFSKNAIARFQQCFTYELMGQKYYDLYKNLTMK